jgi:hypothetical protein
MYFAICYNKKNLCFAAKSNLVTALFPLEVAKKIAEKERKSTDETEPTFLNPLEVLSLFYLYHENKLNRIVSHLDETISIEHIEMFRSHSVQFKVFKTYKDWKKKTKEAFGF